MNADYTDLLAEEFDYSSQDSNSPFLGLGFQSDSNRITLKVLFASLVNAFKESSAYLCYYQFFIPVEYRHPRFEECEEEFWRVLYQLMFGSMMWRCYFVGVGEPDILVHDNKVESFDFVVAFFSLDDIYNLFMSLLCESLLVNTLPKMPMDVMPAVTINNDTGEGMLISRVAFRDLYRYNCGNYSLISRLDDLHIKIEKCYAESFIYRS